MARRRRFVVLHDLSDVGKQSCHVRYRRRNEELTVVFANVVPQEVEAVFNMRDPGLLLREFQAPFRQELLDRHPARSSRARVTAHPP